MYGASDGVLCVCVLFFFLSSFLFYFKCYGVLFYLYIRSYNYLGFHLLTLISKLFRIRFGAGNGIHT